MIDADCLVSDQDAVFMLRNLNPVYHDAALDLAFSPAGNTFTRTFPATSSNLDQICRNFRQAAPDLVLQTARLQAVPWQLSLRTWLERLEGQNVNWFLGGSAALAVRGIAIAPRDFDIVTDEAGAHQLGELFADVLIEPVVAVHGWMCKWFGRAFLKARFEWVGGVDERADVPEVSDYGPQAAQRLETIVWEGYTLLVPPLDLQRTVSKRRGLTERVAAIEQYQAMQG